MNTNIIEAREFIAKAREALKRGDKETARDLGEKAALLAPDMEDAWLVLTAADSNPEDALAYAQKALELNPSSVRARKGVEWAMGRLKQVQAGNVASSPSIYSETPAPQPAKPTAQKSSPSAEKKPGNNRNLLYIGGALALLVCIVLAVAAWWAYNNLGFSPVRSSDNAPAQDIHWARVDVPKAGVTPIDVSAFAPQPTSAALQSSIVADVPAAIPSKVPTESPTDLPTALPTEAATVTPEATETPGVMAMDILADTPTSVYVPPTNAPPVVASGGHGGARWIDVNLSTQSVYAYEGDTVVNSFIVSTGTGYTPTVTGKFKIWIKLKSTNMSGPGYYLPNVPYVMYFYKGYGLHGTYWHNNFGTPMSHGCVNLRTSDAEWLYYWASEGTVVNVHY